ncbi:carboxymuconolactone decarboxylase family protein [Sphingobium nicotianae]|uniref:Carboxymuconolactone decarboxylase family protein n=1 Tax=Sphingobium nicotianae TaxID=2782607 RepID=A0A9X1DDK3_9SPHN|nr:carboxymuconolactone decarboxylase family protein [Sphingobium nicotianae]MBT2187940.1 carboxymuconolactone decarboxylase family protein [Sphingobium nicotianae]
MTAKLDPYAASPSLMKQWTAVSMAVEKGLEPDLVELVKIRSSQINQCANCINMHSVDARAHGETEQRIYLLSAWREAPCYTDRERAALAWTEALTTIAQGHSQEAAHAALAAHFTAEEQVNLTLMINIINGWNRIAVGFGLWYETPAKAAA